jgi:pimeloyl-ACP methyl ester carboxylesterase
VLLHGFPTSSQMFRNLIPALSDRFHVVAPDYPGFGNSAMSPVDGFAYTLDKLAEVVDKCLAVLGIERYSLYMMDYSGPVDFRLAVRRPARVQSLIVQNANAHSEGLREFWDPFRAYWKDRTRQTAKPLEGFLVVDATKWQYTHGVRNTEAISPGTWAVDQYQLDRPGNKDIQLQLFYDYGSNPPLYSEWQAYFREHQPPALIVWGRKDDIFPAEGAHPDKRDLETLEFHLLDTGHFAPEADGGVIAERIGAFVTRHVA